MRLCLSILFSVATDALPQDYSVCADNPAGGSLVIAIGPDEGFRVAYAPPIAPGEHISVGQTVLRIEP